MLKLTTVMLGSDDPKALAGFYTKVLGAPEWDEGGYVGWKAGEGFLMLGSHSEVKGRNEMPGRIIVNFETADVKGEFDRIRKLGAGVVQAPYSPEGAPDGMQLATFEDPDGNYFQIASPM